MLRSLRRGLLRRLLRNERATMTLTLSQMFMGAITIGIAAFRGTESYESFYYETQVGHSSYAASKLAGDHARAANVNATNNVISAAIIGPRFAVEADNITMIANAIIACPQWKNPKMQRICVEFKANHPRMLAKLAWVRLKQQVIWSTLSELSSSIDKVASLRAVEQVQSFTRGVDAAVSVRADDPAMTMNLWGSDSTYTACQNAMTDALPSPMPGAAFPVLIHVNLLAGLPKALVQMMPRLLCGGVQSLFNKATAAATAAADANAASQEHPTEKLPMIPNITKKAEEDCTSLETEMNAAVRDQAAFTTDVAKYAVCGKAAAAPAACTFDRKHCVDDMTEKGSGEFLESVGMPKKSAFSAVILGGATHAPTDLDWNHSQNFRACATSSKAIDPAVINMNDAARKIMSFGQAAPSTTLRARHDYSTCGRWYFPDKAGPFAMVPRDQQPFVAAWKHALVGPKK